MAFIFLFECQAIPQIWLKKRRKTEGIFRNLEHLTNLSNSELYGYQRFLRYEFYECL